MPPWWVHACCSGLGHRCVQQPHRTVPSSEVHQDWRDMESRPCVLGDDLERFRKISLVLARIFLCPS